MVDAYIINDYNTYDAKYTSTFNRPCIDGKISGCGKCVAYCSYEGHPGFLTDELQKKKNCIEKGCRHFIQKPRNVKIAKSKLENEKDRVTTIAASATNDMEGLRVMRTSEESDGTWTVYYVAIAEYSLHDKALEVSERIGNGVRFEKLDYRFEIAASLVFDMKMTA